MNIPIDKFPVDEKTVPAAVKAADPPPPPADPLFDAWYAASAQPKIVGNFLLCHHEDQIRQALAATWYAALVAHGTVPAPPQD